MAIAVLIVLGFVAATASLAAIARAGTRLPAPRVELPLISPRARRHPVTTCIVRAAARRGSGR